MATTINPRDVELQAASARLVGVSLPPNVVVDPDNVDGLGLILDGIKRVWISATSQIFQIAKTGTISPASIVLTANIRDLTGTPTLTIVPGSGTMSVVPALTAGVFSFTPAQLTSDTITLRLSLTEGSTTYSDDFTFVKVREGADSISGWLTNESHTVAADSAGNVLNYNGASGRFEVRLGLLDVRTVSTFAVASGGNPDGLTVAITASGSNAGNYSVTGGFPANKETVTITFNATYGTTVVPKVLTLTKSKAGADGTSGVRGSRSFYYALGGSTNTWSDVIATTTASADGGPILNDQVTEYNNSVDFSQTKFWNGSTWVNVDAVIDGNLLVKGTVGASKVVVNAGAGANVWFDPNYADASAWQPSLWGSVPQRVVITDGIASGTAMRSPAAAPASARGSFRTPAVVGKKYRVSVKGRKSVGANGLLYLRLDIGNSRVGTYSEVIIGIEEVSPSSSGWTEYSAVWTATAPYVSPVLILNIDATAGYMEAQDIRIEEMNAAGLVVQGGIVAEQIDSRGLSVKDASGNVLFAAGTALDYSLVGGTKPPSNATNGATIGTNLDGQITSGNASTYIANAAIGTAQIAELNASKIVAGTITTDKIQVGAVTAAQVGSTSSLNNSFVAGTTQWFLGYNAVTQINTTGAPLSMDGTVDITATLNNPSIAIVLASVWIVDEIGTIFDSLLNFPVAVIPISGGVYLKTRVSVSDHRVGLAATTKIARYGVKLEWRNASNVSVGTSGTADVEVFVKLQENKV